MKCSQNKVLIFCLILGILAFAKPAYSKNLDIKVLMLKQTPIFWPFYIGLEKNYFAEEGVSITPIQLYRLAEIYKAIRNGSIDLAILPSTAVLLENEKSFFLTALSSVSNGDDSSLWTNVKISKLEDQELWGRRIAVGDRQSIDTLFMYGAFKDKGIEPEKINLQFVASYHERIMAARRGLVGLIVLPRMQYLEAKEAGMKNILEFHTFLPTFPSYVLVGSKNWVQKNKDLLTKFLMGQIKAQWFINHNLDESVRLLAEIFIKEPDRNLIKEVTYHRVSNGLIPATAMIDIDTYKKGITLFREYGLKIKAYGDLISELIQKTVNLKFLSKAKINLCKKCWPLPSCPPK